MNPLSAPVENPTYQQLMNYVSNERHPDEEVVIDREGIEYRGFIQKVTPGKPDDHGVIRSFTVEFLGAEGKRPATQLRCAEVEDPGADPEAR